MDSATAPEEDPFPRLLSLVVGCVSVCMVLSRDYKDSAYMAFSLLLLCLEGSMYPHTGCLSNTTITIPQMETLDPLSFGTLDL